MYLVNHPVQLGLPLASFFFLAGLLCIWSNYDSDRQRQQFRQDKGLKDIWGRKPAMIAASYTTEKGEEKESLLLASGWCVRSVCVCTYTRACAWMCCT